MSQLSVLIEVKCVQLVGQPFRMGSRFFKARLVEAVEPENADNCFVVAMIGRKREGGKIRR